MSSPYLSFALLLTLLIKNSLSALCYSLGAYGSCLNSSGILRNGMVSPIILSFCFKHNTKALMCFSLLYTSQEQGIGGLFGNALKQ